MKISKTDKSQSSANRESNKSRIDKISIFQWNTSSLPAAKDSHMAHENKLQEKSKLRKVIDSVNAPKITGKSRSKSLKYSRSNGLKDPASTSAVYFVLIMIQ